MKANRNLLLGASAAAAVSLALVTASCSSVGTHSDLASAKKIVVKDGDRVPASEPRVYWTHAEKEFLVPPSGLNERYDAEIQQVKEWTESVPYQDTCYRDGYTEDQGSCEGYHCSGNGNGKSEAWDAFYSAPRSGKVSALADAIKGVGPVSAQKLVDAGYFYRKPRTWGDFSNEIQRAADNEVVGKDIAYQVLVKYKAENVTNLDYDVSNCTTYQYSCTVYTPGPVAYECTKYKDQTYTREIDSMTRRVSIDVKNPVLQSFETDTASVSVGHDSGDVTVQIGPHNRYNVSVENGYDIARVHATGVQRILVDLPRDVVTSGTFQKRDSQAVFDLRVNSQYLGSGKDQLVLKYNVHTCKMNFFSACLGSYKPGSDVTVPITQSETTVGLPLQSKTKSKVVFTLARHGSGWYNDSFISNFETDSVNQK